MAAQSDPEKSLFMAAQAVVTRIYPQHIIAESVTIRMSNGRRLVLPLPAYVVEVATSAHASAHNSPPTKHSPDFRSVHWFGASYTFTPGQAAVVKILWVAWENGTPEVGGDYLLGQSGLESGRMSDIFKRHPAWSNMIVEGQGQGTFRLAEG